MKNKRLLQYYILKAYKKITSQDFLEWIAIFYFLGFVIVFLEYVICKLWLDY